MYNWIPKIPALEALFQLVTQKSSKPWIFFCSPQIFQKLELEMHFHSQLSALTLVTRHGAGMISAYKSSTGG